MSLRFLFIFILMLTSSFTYSYESSEECLKHVTKDSEKFLCDNGISRQLLRVQKAWKGNNKTKAFVELEFDDGFKQKVFPPYDFEKSEIRYRCPCADYSFSFKDEKGEMIKRVINVNAFKDGIKYFGADRQQYEISDAKTTGLPALKPKQKPEVICSTSYYTDADGNVTVTTDSPSVSDNFKSFKVNDDDGFITMMAVYRSVQDRVDKNGNARLTDIEKDKLQNAFDRMKKYADSLSKQIEGQDIQDANFLRAVNDFNEAKNYIDKLKVKNFGKKKFLKDFGSFLEGRRGEHSYQYKNLGNGRDESFKVCENYPEYRVRCCTDQHIKFNNPISQSLCNVNFNTMKPNYKVLNNDDGARNCTKHTIDIVPSPPIQSKSKNESKGSSGKNY